MWNHHYNNNNIYNNNNNNHKHYCFYFNNYNKYIFDNNIITMLDWMWFLGTTNK